MLERLENEGFGGQKRTKTPILCSGGLTPACHRGATVRDAASGQLSLCRRVRTSGPGSAVAERNLGAARPLRNVIVAAYPLRNVNDSRLPVA